MFIKMYLPGCHIYFTGGQDRRLSVLAASPRQLSQKEAKAWPPLLCTTSLTYWMYACTCISHPLSTCGDWPMGYCSLSYLYSTVIGLSLVWPEERSLHQARAWPGLTTCKHLHLPIHICSQVNPRCLSGVQVLGTFSIYRMLINPATHTASWAWGGTWFGNFGKLIWATGVLNTDKTTLL